MVKVEGLTKFYGSKRAVNRISFQIKKGEVVGLLGLNGSGKTTVLRILAGDLMPTAGRVMINHHNLFLEPYAVKKFLSFLPETPPLYGEMTVKAYLKFIGRVKGLRRKEAAERMDEVMAQAGIDDVADEIISHLSYGYRQRVGIAQALINKPAFLLLDEPASGLDPVQIVEMRRLIRSLRGDHTVILSSHLLSEISQICDRILMVQNGEIIGEGAEETLAQQFTQKLHLRMQVRGTKEGIAEALAGRQEVERIEWQKEEAGSVVFTLHLAQDVREGINQQLVNANLGVLEMTRTDMDLENLFLQLMEKGESAS